MRHHQWGGLLLEVEERVTNPDDDDEECSTLHTLHLPCWDIEEEIAKACAFTSRILAGAAARKMARIRTRYSG